jgi:hypothetical protein
VIIASSIDRGECRLHRLPCPGSIAKNRGVWRLARTLLDKGNSYAHGRVNTDASLPQESASWRASAYLITYNDVTTKRQSKGRWSCGQVVSGGGSMPSVR